MISPSEWRQIEQLVNQMVSIVLSGQTNETQIDGIAGTESIEGMFPGSPGIAARPLAHPYGLVSRAPKGTVQVTARQGEHPANRIVLAHRDINRPVLDAPGDVWLYDAHGNAIKLVDGKVVVKSNAIELGEGATKGVAREGDSTTIDASTSNPLVQFVATVTTVLNGLAPGSLPTPPPTSFPGKITSGSSKVTAVD